MTILDKAAGLVGGDRRKTYGHPKINHGRTAAMWAAYLGVPITPRQVCMMNSLQKISRDAHSPKEDNLVDIAGWALNAEMVDGPDSPLSEPPVLEWGTDTTAVPTSLVDLSSTVSNVR